MRGLGEWARRSASNLCTCATCLCFNNAASLPPPDTLLAAVKVLTHSKPSSYCHDDNSIANNCKPVAVIVTTLPTSKARTSKHLPAMIGSANSLSHSPLGMRSGSHQLTMAHLQAGRHVRETQAGRQVGGRGHEGRGWQGMGRQAGRLTIGSGWAGRQARVGQAAGSEAVWLPGLSG